MSSAPRLLLVEDERHVADLLARRSGERQDRWIALGPSAMNALERQGLRYAIPEDYHRWSELAELCAELHRRVQRLCSELDRALLERAPELAERSIAPFQFHIFPLIMMFDSLAARTLQLRRVLAAHPGATPAIHVRPPQAPTDPELLFSSQETLWGRVLALITGGREADLLADPGPARRASARNLARRLVGSSVTLTTLAMSLRQGGVPRALLGRGESVLLVQGGPEWAAALAAIRRTGLRPLFALEARFAPPLRLAGRDEALDSLIASQLGSLFVVEGVSLYPLLAERLAAIWRQSATAAAMIARRIGAVRRRHRVRAVLRGSVSAGTGHMLNQLARGSGLPVLTWQHGMVTNRGEISQFRQFTDMMTANLVLAFGEESARAYERGRARWPQVSVARVGSATLDAIGERPRACRPPSGTVRVVYATTNYYRNDWYLGFAPGLSDRWLYRDQRTIAAALTEWSAAGRC
ncbi:MAG: hypothetical protein JO206_02505, partial [Solirubrobacterales bacterium]|nr:hypothetical protein [Solirubrobacterales bacterium]MBV9471813.1 hypothetical protein [Solirubrobacterales bacterium]